jgi:hypothetical protein
MQMALSRRSIKRKGAKSPRRKAEETNNQAQMLRLQHKELSASAPRRLCLESAAAGRFPKLFL